MKQYECKTAQAGFAVGKACIVRSGRTGDYQKETPAAENAKLEKAVAEMNRKLSAEKGKDSSADKALIDAEMMILNGEDFLGEASRRIREENLSAPEAVAQAAEKICAVLQNNESDYIRERCEDIRGLASGLNSLIIGSMPSAPDSPCILAGTELSPGEIMMIGTDSILGILTETGSPTSHVSVIAGNLGIPYLYGLKDLLKKVKDGDNLILNTEEDSVVINPPEETIREAELRQAAAIKERSEQRMRAAQINTRTIICANISCAEEADHLLETGADGIGLFRSEFLFLDRPDAPSEDEQFEAYRHAAEAMQGHETVIRTMDIGSDKQALWLKMPWEINPALGLRGLRVSLEHRDLFRTQLRALLRASLHGNIRIMIPMITSVWEVEEVEKEIKIAAEELDQRGVRYRIPELGVMIETPAAVMIASDLAKKARFFSIGTNDLTQYTLAVDREAKGLDPYFDPMHDAVLRMIELATEAAHKNNIPVGICGELAGDPQAAERLIRIGVDELSVSAAKLTRVRSMVADIEEMLDKKNTQKNAQNAQEIHSPADGKLIPREEIYSPADGKLISREEIYSSADGELIPREEIYSPADGELIPMEEIPDPVFSGGIMGECIGILSTDGRIYAPLSGTVASVAAAKHAVSIRGQKEEILVHVGLDTVKLNGEGFRVHVREGDRVEQGQLVMEADLDLISKKGFNPMVIVVRIPET